MQTTFNQKLAIEKTIFDGLSVENKGYHKKPMAEVVEYLRVYMSEMNCATAYNTKVKEYIINTESISDDLIDYLDTEVYLAQQFIREEKKAKHIQDMADKGFIPCKEWNGYTGKVHLVGKLSIDWYTGKIEKEGKIVITNDGKDGFFIPKGNRTRGYYLRNLEDAFYKAL